MTADRGRFVAHVKYWKERLHLGNYGITVEYDYDGVGGECAMNHESLLAIIRIGETDEIWTEPVLARHEMLELLLEPLHNTSRGMVGNDLSYRAGHEIIHRLERILPLPTDKEVGYSKRKKKPKGKC